MRCTQAAAADEWGSRPQHQAAIGVDIPRAAADAVHSNDGADASNATHNADARLASAPEASGCAAAAQLDPNLLFNPRVGPLQRSAASAPSSPAQSILERAQRDVGRDVERVVAALKAPRKPRPLPQNNPGAPVSLSRDRFAVLENAASVDALRAMAATVGALRAPLDTPEVRVATFNVNGSGRGAKREAKLRAVQALMERRRISLVAVQETHELVADRITAEHVGPDHLYLGTPAHAQGRRGGGHGFLIRASLEGAFEYYGRRSDASQFCSAWGRLAGVCSSSDIYMACVYLPDACRSSAKYKEALQQLVDDVQHYGRRPGHVLLLGDFNAHVAAAARVERRVDSAQPSHGPEFGMTDVRPSTAAARGQKLLGICRDHDLFFLSGRTPPAGWPTCRGRTIVDHVVGSRGLLGCAATARTVPSEADDVLACKSDHTPVVITLSRDCPAPTAPTALERHSQRLSEVVL